MRYSGQVTDSETGEGVPAATVELWYNNVMLARVAANGSGGFSIDSASIPDQVRVTSASYKPATYDFNQVSDDSYLPIERNIAEGENVIVTAIRKKPWLVLLALGFLLLLDKNEKK